MKRYRVVIPYYYEFDVIAEDYNDALDKAHKQGDGSIVGWDDEGSVVEEIEDIDES